MKTLKLYLQEWQDWDIAEYYLAVSLGIVNETNLTSDKIDDFSLFRDTKWVYWSNNPIGEMLCDLLHSLVKEGVLEKDEEEIRYRWNPKWELK